MRTVPQIRQPIPFRESHLLARPVRAFPKRNEHFSQQVPGKLPEFREIQTANVLGLFERRRLENPLGHPCQRFPDGFRLPGQLAQMLTDLRKTKVGESGQQLIANPASCEFGRFVRRIVPIPQLPLGKKVPESSA